MSREITEDYVLTMPKEADVYLAALCVLEAFTKMAADADKPWRANYYLQGVNPLFSGFIPEGLKSPRILSLVFEEGDNVYGGEVDVRFTFDTKRAYQMSETLRMHATQTFGIMFGCEPSTLFPFFKPLQDPKKKADIFVVRGPEEASAWWVAALQEFLIQYDVISMKVDSIDKMSLAEVFERVSSVDLVISHANAATYLAAGIGKAVVDIYPQTIHRGWLSKFGNGPYYMVPEEHRDTEMVAQALRSAWHSISRRTV